MLNRDVLTLFFLVSKSALRGLLPNTLVRRMVVLFGALLLLGAVAAGVFLGLHRPPNWEGSFRSEEFVQNISGIFFFITTSMIFLPTFIVIRNALTLLKENVQITLLTNSPQKAHKVFLFTFGPIFLLSSYVYFIILLPFIVAFLVLDPIISLGIFLYYVLLSCWAITLSILSIVIFLEILGKRITLYASYLFPLGLVALPLVFSYHADDLRSENLIYGGYYFTFLCASIFFLPLLFVSTARAFYKHVENHEPFELIEFAPVKWGKFQPWDFLDREVSNWFILPQIILIGLSVFHVLDFGILHKGILASIILSFVINPVQALVKVETNHSFRYKLFPRAGKGRVKSSVFWKMIVPIFTIGFACLIIENLNDKIYLLLHGLIILLILFIVSLEAMFSQKFLRIFILAIGHLLCLLSPVFLK